MSTTTVRPASTTQATGITLHGGSGALHARLNDSSDTSWAECLNGCYGLMRFATASLPVGAVVESAVFTLRSRRATSTPHMSVALAAGGAFSMFPTVGGAFTDTDSTPFYFSNSQIAAGIQIEMTATGTIDVADVELTVTYFAVPVVTVTEPDDPTDVTAPTVRWTTVGERPQSRFQVKEFTQAQVDAPGFNPSTSVALYDSGERLGSVREWTPTTQLENGETYRFYVRAAQLVGSTTQWSVWDFTTATVNAAAPPTPSILALADDLLARIKLTVSTVTFPPGEGYGSGPYGAGPYGGNEGAAAAAAASALFVTIERSADGTTWERVRNATRALMFGDTFIAYDYESCNGELVQYRARLTFAVTGSDVASAWSVLTPPVAWSSPFTWLKSLTLPAANTPVLINAIPTEKYRNPQGVFDIPGRADPIVISAGRKLSEGTITFVTLDTAGLTALRVLFNRAEVLLLQTPEVDGFGCRYIACGDVDENRVTRRSNREERYVDVPFIEVLAPVGDIIGFGVTWLDVINQFATWDDVLDANASWAQLLGVV